MPTSRRELLLSALCLCCTPRGGFAAEAVELQEIAPEVFVRRGLDVDAEAGNADAIANIGFIVGKEAVLVIDPGGSLTDGKWLREQILHTTEKPIRYVVLTHVHPDHCFGACAFAEDRPEFIGHAKLATALQSRGEFYRTKLSGVIGAENVGAVVTPTLTIGADGGEIDLGGRTLTFTAHGIAHTDCDISVMDRSSGLLFSGDLLFVTRIPSLDGSLLGWLNELDRLEALKARTIVPGHGPVTVNNAAFLNLRRYLTALRDGTRAVIRDGRSIEYAANTVARSEENNWALFDAYHSHNVIQAFKELEWE